MNWKSPINWLSLSFLIVSTEGLFGQSINNFSPAYGLPNTEVVINGSGFTSSTVVKFNGIKANSRLTATTQIHAFSPSGVLGPVQISVQNPGGAAYNSRTYFTNITTAPYIFGFDPNQGNAGTPITITGINFTGTSKVTVGGVSVGYALNSDTSILVTGLGSPTTGPISITSPKGTYTTGTNAYFYGPPSISGFSPTNGLAGTIVTITGMNFLGASSVTFNGVSALFTNISNTTITAVVPLGATRGKIEIETPAMPVTSTKEFSLPPVIYGFSPPSGGVGDVVTVAGDNLNVGTTTLKFNGTKATIIANTLSPTQCRATVPNGASSGPLTVTTDVGTNVTTQNFYLPPSISNFLPPTGETGTVVTITGASLTNATNVRFNGAEAAFKVVDNGKITATVPTNATSGTIEIIAPGGYVYSSGSFYVQPHFISFSPDAGIVGSQVKIVGANFEGTTNVLFNGVLADFALSNSTVVVATVPTNATTGPITVKASGGSVTSANSFRVDPLQLKISSLTNHLVTISWPTSAVNFVLQFATQLENTNPPDTNQWLAVTNTPTVQSISKVVTNKPDGARYYRLKK